MSTALRDLEGHLVGAPTDANEVPRECPNVGGLLGDVLSRMTVVEDRIEHSIACVESIYRAFGMESEKEPGPALPTNVSRGVGVIRGQ